MEAGKRGIGRVLTYHTRTRVLADLFNIRTPWAWICMCLGAKVSGYFLNRLVQCIIITASASPPSTNTCILPPDGMETNPATEQWMVGNVPDRPLKAAPDLQRDILWAHCSAGTSQSTIPVKASKPDLLYNHRHDPGSEVW